MSTDARRYRAMPRMRPLPKGLSPMLATAGALPDDDGQWAHEVKWDGVRVIAQASAAGVRYTSRLGNDVTAAYPELRNLAGQLGPRQAILDGEIATFDRRGRTDFGLLQSRMHVRRPTSTLVTSTPVTFLIFDVLHVNDTSLLDASYDTRREALEDLGLAGDAWQAPAAIVGDGATILQQSKAQGLEGIAAKQRRSTYLPGRRTKSWLKIKNIRRTSGVICSGGVNTSSDQQRRVVDMSTTGSWETAASGRHCPQHDWPFGGWLASDGCLVHVGVQHVKSRVDEDRRRLGEALTQGVRSR